MSVYVNHKQLYSYSKSTSILILHLIYLDLHSLLRCRSNSNCSGWIIHAELRVAITEIHTQATILNRNLLWRYISVSPIWYKVQINSIPPEVYIENGQIWTKFHNERNRNLHSLEKDFRSSWRTSKNKLAFGPLGQEWADHGIESQIPPRNIDEHLKKQIQIGCAIIKNKQIDFNHWASHKNGRNGMTNTLWFKITVTNEE